MGISWDQEAVVSPLRFAFPPSGFLFLTTSALRSAQLVQQQKGKSLRRGELQETERDIPWNSFLVSVLLIGKSQKTGINI